MNLGLLSPLLGRRRLVEVGGANTRIGGEGGEEGKMGIPQEINFDRGE